MTRKREKKQKRRKMSDRNEYVEEVDDDYGRDHGEEIDLLDEPEDIEPADDDPDAAAPDADEYKEPDPEDDARMDLNRFLNNELVNRTEADRTKLHVKINGKKTTVVVMGKASLPNRFVFKMSDGSFKAYYVDEIEF